MDDENRLPKAPYYFDEDAIDYSIWFRGTLMLTIPKAKAIDDPFWIESIVFNLNAAYLMGWLKC